MPFKNLKNIQITCLMLLCLCAPLWAEKAETVSKNGNLDIYLLIGARNMCGRGFYTKSDMTPVPKSFLLNRKDEWESALAPMNRHSSIVSDLFVQKYGIGSSFLRGMHAKDASAYIGLVVNAKGKTSVKDWVKGSKNYDEAVRRVKIAQKNGVLRGILWHQGETDSKETQYLTKLKEIISDFRKDFAQAELPFVVGEIYKGETFNKNLGKISTEVPFSGCVSAEGLKTRGPLRFDIKSLDIFGQRYAEVLQKVQGKRVGPVSAAPALPKPITYEGKKEDLHMYLLIGQSNMSGRAPYMVEDVKPIEGAWLLGPKNTWEEAQVPINRHSSIIVRVDVVGFNPGLTFAKTMRKANPKASIGLISNARGSTPIGSWGKGSIYYEAALKRVKAAQEIGTLKGILWHQGESNERDTEYLGKLTAMIESWRKDLNMPDLPFVVGEITSKKAGVLINSQLNQLPKALAHTGVASSKDLELKDKWHFKREAMITFGERYAKEMLKLLGQ